MDSWLTAQISGPRSGSAGSPRSARRSTPNESISKAARPMDPRANSAAITSASTSSDSPALGRASTVSGSPVRSTAAAAPLASRTPGAIHPENGHFSPR